MPRNLFRRARARTAALGLISVLAAAAFAPGAAAANAAPTGPAHPPQYEVTGSADIGRANEGIAVDPDRDLVYVASRSAGLLRVVDGASLDTLRTVALPEQPYQVLVGPSGVVYVTLYGGNNAPGSIAVIAPGATGTPTVLPAGVSPAGLAISPDGSRLYVSSFANPGGIRVFDLSVPTAPVALQTLVSPSWVDSLTVSADGRTVYAAGYNAGAVQAIDASTGGSRALWPTGRFPHKIALTSSGNRAVIALQGESAATVLDTGSGVASASIPLANTYFQDEDPGLGAMFITAPFTGTVGVLDRSTGELAQRVDGVDGAFFIAANPKTHAVYTTSAIGSRLTRIEPAVRLTSPQSIVVTDGDDATFTAGISGIAADGVRWERRSGESAPWAPIAGSSAEHYTLPRAELADSGAQFRAVFTAGAASWTTRAATLTVRGVAPSVIAHPEDRSIPAGGRAVFESAATGSAPLSVRWERSSDDGENWAVVPGATSTVFESEFGPTDSGTLFRAVFENPFGTAVSDLAELTVVAGSDSDASSAAGATASASAGSDGTHGSGGDGSAGSGSGSDGSHGGTGVGGAAAETAAPAGGPQRDGLATTGAPVPTAALLGATAVLLGGLALLSAAARGRRRSS
ncbi:YncE family protein [Leucobacter sp. HNU]|uniref:YncE family protein n=1 Tax=Leucobacter sp. HNU TaxID=3236805 RepID=UPI003A80DC7E